MAVLSHEGTYSILFGTWPLPVGTSHRTGYIARPDTAGRFPVVLVLASLDGMASQEKDLCRRLARSGFCAITFDPYGTESGGLDEYNALLDARALTDLDEIHDFVASSDVDWAVSSDVGVIGLDVGGRFGLIAAATRPWVKSLIVASTPLTGDEGRAHQVADYLHHLPVPVLGLYGTNDSLIASATVDEAQRRNDHGQWLLYEGAGHAFMDVDGEEFDQSAADDAFARIIAFFSATLPPGIDEDLG